jgi:tripartite-type tricarboxylate transporter receptor subunit TctC
MTGTEAEAGHCPAISFLSRDVGMKQTRHPGSVQCAVSEPPMRASLGQPFVIEIAGGANGSIGTGRAARAVGDGYTLVFGNWNTHVANAVIYRLQYDILRDFEPVALLASNPFLIVARSTIAANDLKEFIAGLAGERRGRQPRTSRWHFIEK